MNLLEKTNLFLHYGLGLLGLSNHDVIFTSFPKSGNTWIRFFLCNLISLQEWGGKTVDFNLLDRTMPELGVSNLLKKWDHKTIPRVVKTHKSYWSLFRNKKAILLLRDPKDVMVSYYRYQMGKREPQFQGSFSEFIRSDSFGLEAWINHYLSWREQAGLIVYYEQLKKDDRQEFKRIVDYLEIDLPDKTVSKAVEKSRFKNVKKVEAKHGLSKSDTFKKDFKFVRKGTSGGWQEHFAEGDIAYYKKTMKSYGINIYNE